MPRPRRLMLSTMFGCLGAGSWRLLLLLLWCARYKQSVCDYTASGGYSYEMPEGRMTSFLHSSMQPTNPSLTVPEVNGGGCCEGTLGYASGNYLLPYPCANSKCCNDSETVAVIPVDIALGFKFVCMPRKSVRTLCYQAGSEVCTSNEDPDHVPRICCMGARFTILVNLWYAAMIVKCTEEVQTNR